MHGTLEDKELTRANGMPMASERLTVKNIGFRILPEAGNIPWTYPTCHNSVRNQYMLKGMSVGSGNFSLGFISQALICSHFSALMHFQFVKMKDVRWGKHNVARRDWTVEPVGWETSSEISPRSTAFRHFYIVWKLANDESYFMLDGEMWGSSNMDACIDSLRGVYENTHIMHCKCSNDCLKVTRKWKLQMGWTEITQSYKVRI